MRLPKLPPHYYFVPFGREPGGFLEALDLPPTVTEAEVNGRYATYMKELEDAYIEQRRPAKAKVDYAELLKCHEHGEITDEQFETNEEMLVLELIGSEKRAALELMRARSELADGKLTESRFRNRLRAITRDIGFADLYADFQANNITSDELDTGLDALISGLDQLIATGIDIETMRDDIVMQLRTQPLTREEFDIHDVEWREVKTQRETEINKLKKQWDQGESIKRKAENSGFAYDDTTWFEDADSKASFSAIEDTLLHSADVFWSRIGGTGRAWWMSQQDAWLTEFKKLGPTFTLHQLGDATGALSTVRPMFPNLSQPTSRAINELSQEEMADLTQMPQRAGDVRVRNIGDLLAELQQQGAKQGGSAQVSEEDQATVNRTQAAKILADILNEMAQAGRQKMDD